MLLLPELEILLLNNARKAIDAVLNGHEPVIDKFTDPALTQRVGCFVTLKIGNRLRGCLGNFTSQEPLYREVVKMAIAAATSDPRFPPMTSSDIGSYSLDISVLSPLEKIDDTNLIEVGIHGIYLIKGPCRGVLLPQVATEHGWDRSTFLDQTCIKAGLPVGDWQSPQTEIYIFSAQIITEQEDCGFQA